MSVPVGKRSKNKLEVWMKAVDLAKYTMQITANTRNFPGRYRTMVMRINDAAINCAADLWKANKIYIGKGCDPRAKQDRTYLQNKAIGELDELLFLLDLAESVMAKPNGDTPINMFYWAEKAVSVKQLAQAWRDSDKSRG